MFMLLILSCLGSAFARWRKTFSSRTAHVFQALQSKCGSANQRCTRSDDVNGNTSHQVLEASLSGEGFDKARISKRLQQVQGNATGHVNSSCCQHFEREIAGFAGEDRNQHFDSSLAKLAGMVWVNSCLNNHLRMILG